jgi:hypothetical protein
MIIIRLMGMGTINVGDEDELSRRQLEMGMKCTVGDGVDTGNWRVRLEMKINVRHYSAVYMQYPYLLPIYLQAQFRHQMTYPRGYKTCGEQDTAAVSNGAVTDSNWHVL